MACAYACRQEVDAELLLVDNSDAEIKAIRYVCCQMTGSCCSDDAASVPCLACCLLCHDMYLHSKHVRQPLRDLHVCDSRFVRRDVFGCPTQLCF